MRKVIRLTVIVGPTASGKTRLAVEVAHALKSEIVSVDSRQVYRGLDIGSGKDLDEYRRTAPPVPVHLVDVADPETVYSVFQYQRDCYRLLADSAERAPYREGTPLVMAGGTGLYVEAVLKGYRIPDVREDAALRSSLMGREVEELVSRLEKENPKLAKETDLGNKKRVVRALEIASSEQRAAVHYSEPSSVTIKAAVFGISCERRVLNKRIDDRLDERLALGLVDEVRGLLADGLPAARLSQLGLEYREVAAYLTGLKEYEEMVSDLRRGIHRFAKRQQTWFRGMERRGIPVTWIGPGESDSVIAASR
jgi:tRNA dimethylallyltransferase